MLQQKVTAHGAMERISFVLWITVSAVMVGVGLVSQAPHPAAARLYENQRELCRQDFSLRAK